MNLSDLSERRAIDRHLMAKEVVRIAHKYGHQVETEVAGVHGPRCVCLSITTADGRLACSVEFSGDSPQAQPNTFVLPWHLTLACPRDVYLNPATFDFAVNKHHGAKATLVRYGFNDLCAHLDAVLSAAADGSAYSTDRPPLARSHQRHESLIIL